MLEVAGWGASLGDLATPTDYALRESVMQESALFNLGVALFDSFVDDQDPRVAEVSVALSPDRLSARLVGSELLCHWDAVADSGTRAVVRLFDVALRGVRERCDSDPIQLNELSNLLTRMYHSELGNIDDPFAAKRLPVEFIGHLGAVSGCRRRLAMFEKLAIFLQRFDDWQDISDDFLARAPNSYLSHRRPVGVLASSQHACAGLWLILRGSRYHSSLSDSLVSSMSETLAEARKLGSIVEDKLVLFLRQLVS